MRYSRAQDNKVLEAAGIALARAQGQAALRPSVIWAQKKRIRAGRPRSLVWCVSREFSAAFLISAFAPVLLPRSRLGPKYERRSPRYQAFH